MADTAERLQAYYDFAPDVVETVNDVAGWQRRFNSYGNFFEAAHVGNPQLFEPDGFLPVRVLDIKPVECNPVEALAVHLPMASPLDPYNIYLTHLTQKVLRDPGSIILTAHVGITLSLLFMYEPIKFLTYWPTL